MQVRYVPKRGLAEIASAPQSRSGLVRDLGLEKSLEMLDLMGLFLHILIHRAPRSSKRQLAPLVGTPLTLRIAEVDQARRPHRNLFLLLPVLDIEARIGERHDRS